jgi:hypothetical protein
VTILKVLEKAKDPKEFVFTAEKQTALLIFGGASR